MLLRRAMVATDLTLVGNIPAPSVAAGDRGFVVADNDSFVNLAAALGRSCDVQVSPTVIRKRNHMLTLHMCSITNAPTKRMAKEASVLAIATRRTPNVMQLSNPDSVSSVNHIWAGDNPDES